VVDLLIVSLAEGTFEGLLVTDNERGGGRREAVVFSVRKVLFV